MIDKYKCSICGETGHTRPTHSKIEKVHGTRACPICSICGSEKHYASWHRQEEIKGKKCSYCKLMLPISCFSYTIGVYKTNGSEYKMYRVWCNNCRNDNDRRRYESMDEDTKRNKSILAKTRREHSLNHRIQTVISQSAGRAFKKGFAYDIDYDYIMEVYNQQEGKCFYSGDDLALSGSSVLSIDRFDSLRGYTKDNIVLCTWAANNIKNSFMYNDFINLCGRIWNKANKKK